MAKLGASDVAANDSFGFRVAISGNLALVAAHLNDDNGASSGSAYIFANTSGSIWTEQTKLTASDAAAGDTFGTEVSISGNVALVSAPYNDDNGTDSGSAYVFANSSGNTWTEVTKLTAGATAGDIFGEAAFISGNVVVIGAQQNDQGGSDAGAAYVFVQNSGNGLWSFYSKLLAFDAAAGDQFGSSISFSNNIIIVGSIFDDDGASNAGSMYFFNVTSSNDDASNPPPAISSI